MGRLLEEEVGMFQCPVCHAEESRGELVDEVFHIGAEYVLVGSIPATVCVRCGEQSFSRETAERVRLMVNGDAPAARFIPMRALDFAS